MSELLLAKLTARGVALSHEGKGGKTSIAREDVSAALAYGDLSRLAYLLGMFKYVDDKTVAEEFWRHCTTMVEGVATLKKWRMKPEYAKGMAWLAIVEVCYPHVCRPCSGTGLVKLDRQCSECAGDGVSGRRSMRVKADIAGISKSRFSEVWESRYELFYSRLADAEHELLRHLRRQLFDADKVA